MAKQTFILFHPCFMGGWAWKPVADRLHAQGHAAYYPSLDGCGDRTSSLRPGITVATQAREIAHLMYMEDIRDVHLVGTSTGALVACAVAAQARERVSRITFVDAVVLKPGQRLRDAWPERDMKPFDSDGVSIPIRLALHGYEGCDPATIDWAQQRATPMPHAVMNEPMEDSGFWRQQWRTTVICCTKSTNPGEAHQRLTAQRLGSEWRELATGHYPFLSVPDQLTSMLVE